MTVQQLADKISCSGTLGLSKELTKELAKQLPTHERTN
jgi:Rod binding domain-containing protein